MHPALPLELNLKDTGASSRRPAFPSAPTTSQDLTVGKAAVSQPSEASENSDDEVILFSGRKGSHVKGKEKALFAKTTEKALIDDYITNLKENDPEQTRSLGLDGSDEVDEKPVNNGKQKAVDDGDDEEDGWGSLELQDFDDISTSSETMGATPRVLARRTRNAGYQYLVAGMGEPTDLARWLPKERLTAPGAAEIISDFEKTYESFEDASSSYEDDLEKLIMDNDSMDNDSSMDDSDSAEDDKDLEERRQIKISDEQIARLLTKQAELGIDGDELLLYNGDGFISETSLDGPLEFDQGKIRGKKTKAQPRARAQKSEDKMTLPDFLDSEQYGDFDVMDRERMSIQRKPKKCRQPEDFLELSDPELLQDLSAAWQNDRKKKKQKKQEREELRSQGLLGRNGKRDLKAKYRNGMSIDELKDEIKDFLMSPTESLPLPPMNDWERKMVHELAHKLSMKSKSRGHGPGRFPVLYKTSRTKGMTEGKLALVDNMFTPKKLQPKQRKGAAAAGGASSSTKRNGLTGVKGNASYRDGDVVGIGAPELGKENRGRAMLEKMGWSNGTALGALNNKGIVQPVAQVVKTTKAGLG